MRATKCVVVFLEIAQDRVGPEGLLETGCQGGGFTTASSDDVCMTGAMGESGSS